jgi:hypothetical protein
MAVSSSRSCRDPDGFPEPLAQPMRQAGARRRLRSMCSGHRTLWPDCSAFLHADLKKPGNSTFALSGEQKMRQLILTILSVSLLSLPAAAQSNHKSPCPAGYDVVGKLCQDSSTGDIVLPN